MFVLILASILTGCIFGALASAVVRALESHSVGRRGPALAGAALAPSAVLLLPQSDWPAAVLFGTLLLAIAWLDLCAGIVHAALVVPLTLVGLALAALHGPEALADAAAGTMLGYLAFRAIEAGFRHFRGRDGLGRGDAWVLGAVGSWVGVHGLGPLVAIAAGISLAAVLLRDRALCPNTSVPFAPALASAAWLVWTTGGGSAGWSPSAPW